ncbi:MAG: outer membrane beta-barrel protein [Phycisphaerales bacterium]
MRDESCLRWSWALAALLMTATASRAFDDDLSWSRAGRGDVYFIFQTLGSDATTGLDGTAEIEMDDGEAYGAGLGWNFTDHFNVNTEVFFGDAGFRGTSASNPGVVVREDTDIWAWQANLDYNILKSRLTPLVTGGLGVMGWHSDVITERNFSYNLGAGARWDVAENLAMKLLYRVTWTEIEDADDPFEFDGLTFELIYMFP